jgi:hypothetical protein
MLLGLQNAPRTKTVIESSRSNTSSASRFRNDVVESKLRSSGKGLVLHFRVSASIIPQMSTAMGSKIAGTNSKKLKEFLSRVTRLRSDR